MTAYFRDLMASNPDPRVGTVLAKIAADPACELAELAAMVGLSSSRLSHLFKRDTGRDLRSFLAEQRLQAAAQMLARAGSSVKEVSYNVGYSHPASFVRAFRRHFGAAPKLYRAAISPPGTADSANKKRLTCKAELLN